MYYNENKSGGQHSAVVNLQPTFKFLHEDDNNDKNNTDAAMITIPKLFFLPKNNSQVKNEKIY